MLKQVKLYGHLAKKYGREFTFDVNSPAEAVRALTANFNDFPTDIVTHPEGYHILIDDAGIEEGQLYNPVSQSISIVPVVAGSKSKFFGIITGAALIGASFFLPTTALFTVGSFAPSLASISFGLGVSLALGGVAQLLTPTPKNTQNDTQDARLNSYSFSGPVNVSRQGAAVPIFYGELYIGSAVISSGISTDNVVIAAATKVSSATTQAATTKEGPTQNTSATTKGSTGSPTTTGKT